MPAGLVIYWTWNNFLSIVQQTFIMRRMGTPVEFGRALGINYARRLLSGSKARPPDKKTG